MATIEKKYVYRLLNNETNQYLGTFSSIEVLVSSECSPLNGLITAKGLQKSREKQGNLYPYNWRQFTIQREILIGKNTRNFTDAIFDDPDLDPSVFEDD